MAYADVARRLGSYLGTGVASLVVDMGGLYLLHAILGVQVGVAAVISFLASFAVNFTLNQRMTFRADTGGSPGQLVRFTILVGFNTVVTGLAVSSLTAAGLHFMIAKLLVVATLFVFNYFVLRHWVFRGRPDADR